MNILEINPKKILMVALPLLILIVVVNMLLIGCKRQKSEEFNNKEQQTEEILLLLQPPSCTNYTHVSPASARRYRIKTVTIEEKHQYYVFDNGIFPELTHYHDCKFCKLKKFKEKFK